MKQEIMRLQILGALRSEWFPKFYSALGLNKSEKNDALLFCNFSNFDIPIGFRFKVVRNSSDTVVFRGDIELISVSQAFAVKFDYIPKGHKTVCKFRFKDDIPEVVRSVPLVEDWYEWDSFLIFENG